MEVQPDENEEPYNGFRGDYLTHRNCQRRVHQDKHVALQTGTKDSIGMHCLWGQQSGRK